MKNIFSRYFMMLAGLAAVFSCVEPEDEPKAVAPVFPSAAVVKTVQAGESVELTFEANQKWTVSVTGEGSGNMFWIDDDGMKKSSLTSTETGNVNVTVIFSDVEEFDRTRVCVVTLEMGGEKMDIATLSRLPKSRTVEFYIGVPGEIDFEKTSGRYVFEETSVKTGKLKTFEGVVTYELPIKVVSNYSWDMALPEWVSATVVYPASEGDQTSISGEAGETEILLSAVMSEATVAGIEGTINIIDKTNTESVSNFGLVMPSYDDRMEFTINSDRFNVNAQLLMPNGSYSEEASPAIAYVLAAEGTRVAALEIKDGQFTGNEPEWLHILNEYDATLGYLQSFPVQFNVDINTELDRSAGIFVFPPKAKDLKLSDVLTADKKAVKEEYQKYHVTTLFQEGVIPPYITPVSTEDAMLEVGTYYAVLEVDSDENVMQVDFPQAPSYQRFIYTTAYSHEEATFDCFKPFAKCELYKDTEYPNGLFIEMVGENEDYWLSFAGMADNTKGRFNIEYTPSQSAQAAAVFYDESGEMLGCVLIRYDAASSGTDEVVINIENGEGILSKLGEESEIYQVLASEYSIDDVYELATSDPAILLSSSVAPAKIVVNQALPPFAQYQNSPFDIELVETMMIIDNSQVTETTSAVIVLKDENLLNLAAIYYTYNHIQEEPEQPETPEDPETPDQPETPEDPENPEPDQPETPVEPGEPEPGEPEQPEGPGEEEEDDNQPIEVDPAVIFSLEVGSAELLKLDAESELLKKVYKKYKITQLYQVTTLSKMTTLVLDSAYEVFGGIKLDPSTFGESESVVSLEPMSQNIVMYSGGATSRQEALYVLMLDGDVPFAAIHYIFDPYADIYVEPAFKFVYPDNVSGATLNRYTESDLQSYLDEFYGVEPHNVYELVYTVENPTRANISVPSQPAFGAAWGNEEGSKTYWLTYTKVSAKNILVKMTEPGLKDHFVFKTSDGMFSHVLICTYKPAN